MLTDTQVQEATAHDKPYKLSDQHGLYLHVLTTGTKIWRHDYRLHGKRATLTIGRFPDVTLTAARELHTKARQLIARGENPAVAKQAEKATAKAAARAAWEKARERKTTAKIATFAHKKMPELSAVEGVIYVTALTDIVTCAFDAFADRFFDRLERTNALARAPGEEEGSQ